MSSATAGSSATPLARKLGVRPGAELALISGVATDLSFDVVQQAGLDVGLVDNKVAAIDATWSALRFVVRRADR